MEIRPLRPYDLISEVDLPTYLGRNTYTEEIWPNLLGINTLDVRIKYLVSLGFFPNMLGCNTS